jgi:hypothetical protein
MIRQLESSRRVKTASVERVRALLYTASQDSIEWTVVDANRVLESGRVSEAGSVLKKTQDLRAELARTMNVAADRCKELDAFAEVWGRRLLPDSLFLDPPDVLLIIPYAFTHLLPLHIVEHDGRSLGEIMGVAYASSCGQFVRCARRNRSRRGLLRRRRRIRFVASDVLGPTVESYEEAARVVGRRVAGAARVSFDDWRAARRVVRQELSPWNWEAADVLFILAHGSVDQRNHNASGLLLGNLDTSFPWRNRKASGRTFAFPEAPALPLPPHLTPARPAALLSVAELDVDCSTNAELIVLMCCSAGWGELLRADEPASLAENLIKAGAGSVVSPMWDADLDAATAWMSAFLESWLAHASPKAIAVQQAYTCLREMGWSRAKRASFVLKGDWL